MALRCKGLACDALNFPAETYRCMFHLIEAMTQVGWLAECYHWVRVRHAQAPTPAWCPFTLLLPVP